jgi:hypothetical protein
LPCNNSRTSCPRTSGAMLQDDPQSLARAATRAEVRQPGILDRTFGGMGGGGMMGGGMMRRRHDGRRYRHGRHARRGLLTSIAGSFIGSSIAHSFFNQPDVINNFYGANPNSPGRTATTAKRTTPRPTTTRTTTTATAGLRSTRTGTATRAALGDLGDSFGGDDAGATWGRFRRRRLLASRRSGQGGDHSSPVRTRLRRQTPVPR